MSNRFLAEFAKETLTERNFEKKIKKCLGLGITDVKVEPEKPKKRKYYKKPKERTKTPENFRSIFTTYEIELMRIGILPSTVNRLQMGNCREKMKRYGLNLENKSRIYILEIDSDNKIIAEIKNKIKNNEIHYKGY